MSAVAKNIQEIIKNASWIRRMFEAGIALKKEFGEEAVCDFSLGNPDLAPPEIIAKELKRLSENATKPFAFGYMPNAGLPVLREALAKHLSKEQGVELTANEIIATVGAAGGLNTIFRTILEHGDKILGISPNFVEYGFYVGNYGGVFETVASKPDTFELDLEAIEKALTPKTKALMMNSPNNPTGQIYSAESLKALAAILKKKSAEFGYDIYLISDEPYRFLTYDNAIVPPILSIYSASMVVNSASKSLSLPGERIGFIALSPLMKERAELMAGLTLASRILGFVNPPVVGQYLMLAGLESQVDASVYARRRALMAEVLTKAGYEFFMPKGAFYFFVKAPNAQKGKLGDDVAFVNGPLLKEKILAVPGSGFNGAGYFRLAFCVDEAVIKRSEAGFKRALDSVK
ncbi:pyridoxal phosphate-dependent aminotransferase [Desulfovibrio litoralis]|uniref:Aminotransferase n=1 Tax=Desulfovibrio litoralis DSM 11393 TaxID=1121455 RepID=A0A1M7TFB6_9BACT|nr:pyridoxal phosphate-dependent aminotransferase [Desulfovibrio litoralis]SHN69454.1 aspartate aminotransferase [Desulfovibrio litoralis DSM 11393]